MTSPAQYLYDHQWDFLLYSDDYSGCVSCREEKPLSVGYGGHRNDCELAAILAQSGFEVQYQQPPKFNPLDTVPPDWSGYPQSNGLEIIIRGMAKRMVRDAE